MNEVLRAGKRRPLKSTLLLIMSLVAAVLATPTASAADGDCVESGNYETCFTYGSGNTDRIIIAKIKAKVEATTAAARAGATGDYIRVALFDWGGDDGGGGMPLANALADAANAGVSVRVVVDTIDSNVEAVLDGANIDLNKCGQACVYDRTDPGAMHNKFFLIKKGDTQLVLQSSSNVGETQAQHAQNMLIVRDDAALFSAYLNYWRRMYSESWNYGGVDWDSNVKRTYDGSSALSKAYFYPQPESTRVKDVLGNVTSCDAPDNDRVWLEASLIDSSPYAADIVGQLKHLKNLGCDVKVLIQKQEGAETLKAAGINYHCDGYNHNKLMLIDAYYAGSWRKAVFTGSYNLTANSAHDSNDAMLRVINDWVTNQYVEQFKTLWAGSNACDGAGDGSSDGSSD